LKFKAVKEIKSENELSFTWQVQGHAKNHQQFITDIVKDMTVKRFEY
jgi:hypothetical protein